MRFSIGTDDFKEIRINKDSAGQVCFYSDKSLLIRDVVDDGAKVIVLPRPRRFGKTLNLSMLKYFFDISADNADLFENLKIANHKNIMENWQGKYPVVFICFKSLRAQNFEQFKTDLKITIFNCYKDFEYLRTSQKLTELDKAQIEPYFSENFNDSGFTNSLKRLTEMLEKHHGQKVIILIDEYDTPLQDAYVKGFFKEATEPFRNMLGEALKGNVHLYKGVLTGITRIAKESLFSGINNLQVYDITDNKYAEYFGFSEEEVKKICDPKHLDDLKSWYNGYTFGDDLTIYNPWSILNCLSKGYKFSPYWVNASSNDIIRENVTADKLEDVKALIEGQSIAVEIEPFTVMDKLKTNPTSFWNLSFMAGFLTLDADKKLRIPNKELQYFFEKTVLEWFSPSGDMQFLSDFLTALVTGFVEKVQIYLSSIIMESFSFHDVNALKQESFYHGFLLGLSLGLKGRYAIKSNRESGFGRYDIALYPSDPAKDPGIIIEVKLNKGSAEEALLQIQDKAYGTDLRQQGCKMVLLYGLHFDGKKVSTTLVTEKS
jgi:hypothetical protein